MIVAATGMNSATTMLLALVPAGGHIITTTDCYRRTRQFIQTVLPKMGISATVIDPSDMEVRYPLLPLGCTSGFANSPESDMPLDGGNLRCCCSCLHCMWGHAKCGITKRSFAQRRVGICADDQGWNRRAWSGL